MRIILAATFALGALATLPAAEPSRPLSPTTVTWEKPNAVLGEAADELSKQSGVSITVAPGVLKAKFDPAFKGFKRVPFWEGLQAAADASNTRIALSNGGRKAELVPRGKSRESAATS